MISRSVLIAMLTSRASRPRMLAIVGLAALFVTVLVACLPPRPGRVLGSSRLRLSDVLGAERPAASPREEMQALEPAPAPLLGREAALRNAEAPFAAVGPAAQPYRFAGREPDRLRARTCLAAAMLYEAGDDVAGQLAVGQVVLNRARHPAFPASVCGVVTQGSDRSSGCQFTFTCDGSLARHVSDQSKARALTRASLMLDGMVFAPVGLATHYHTVDVYPWWSPRLQKIARVGAHLFFRWPGYWGSARALLARQAGGEPSAALFARFEATPPALGEVDPLIAVQSSVIDLAEPAVLPGQTFGAQLRGSPPAGPEHAAAAIPSARRLFTGAKAAAVTAGWEPEAIVVGGAALGGNRLLRMFPEDGVFFLELASGSSEPSRRRAAESLCGGRSECRVYGWRSAAAAPRGPQLDQTARNALDFTFVRAPASKDRPVSASAAHL